MNNATANITKLFVLPFGMDEVQQLANRIVEFNGEDIKVITLTNDEVQIVGTFRDRVSVVHFQRNGDLAHAFFEGDPEIVDLIATNPLAATVEDLVGFLTIHGVEQEIIDWVNSIDLSEVLVMEVKEEDIQAQLAYVRSLAQRIVNLPDAKKEEIFKMLSASSDEIDEIALAILNMGGQIGDFESLVSNLEASNVDQEPEVEVQHETPAEEPVVEDTKETEDTVSRSYSLHRGWAIAGAVVGLAVVAGVIWARR